MTDVILETWVILERGVPIKTYEMNQGESFDFSANPEKDTVLYDPAIHTIQPRPKRPEFVNKDVFLFELFSQAEYLTLQFHVRRIDTLGEWDTLTPTAQGQAYRGLELAQQQLDMVERVQLASPRTSAFLDLCFALQFWGDPTDPANAATYAARKQAITLGIRPDGTFVNDE